MTGVNWFVSHAFWAGQRKKILTLAWNETGVETCCGAIAAMAKAHGDHYRLNGTKTFVPFSHVADHIIVTVRTGPAGNSGEEGISLFLVDRDLPGVHTEVIETLADDKTCELRLDNVEVPSENMLGKKDQGWPILKAVFETAAVLKCTEMMFGSTDYHYNKVARNMQQV